MNEYKYCPSLTKYKRLQTKRVNVGGVIIGSGYPIRIQTMTNTDTGNTEQTVEQIKRIADAGADIVRMTTRNISEAENIRDIKETLQNQGYRIPIVADVHFNPKIAETAASIVDKVRINPGNYGIKKSDPDDFHYTRKHFIRLINTCKVNNTAIRIGVNHGSLSQRIMDLYGNTPKGMVHSALEFLEICRDQDFQQVIVSMKSSNTRVMVQANRLLVHHMYKSNLFYPLHLGVTEAGEGEDGRIKSAVGIGALLVDGIGDTIRVSLTESPEKEIPFARKLVKYIQEKKDHDEIQQIRKGPINPFRYVKRTTKSTALFNSNSNPVFGMIHEKTDTKELLKLQDVEPDFIIKTVPNPKDTDKLTRPLVIRHEHWIQNKSNNAYPYFHSIHQFVNAKKKSPSTNFIFVTMDDIEEMDSIKKYKNVVLILQHLSTNPTAEHRRFIIDLIRKFIKLPVIVHGYYREDYAEDLLVKASTDLGVLFIDGLAEGIFVENRGKLPVKDIMNTSFGILQASRMRIYKTEFISCPGCGRTQFDLEKTTREVREKLGHLKGLKIAVMGCIVNGPGEMADADYGYVGSGKGKVTLYKKKEIIHKNIPEHKALDELIRIIQNNGDWVER